MWFTLIISTAFTAVAVGMLWLEPAASVPALATGSFFGLCAAVALRSLVGKAALRRSLASPAMVSVVGGVAIPMRRRPLWLTAGALCLVGGLGVLSGRTIAALYPWLSGLIALAGLVLAGGLVTGRIARRRLRFAPDGLWVEGREYRFCLPWDGLRADLGEINDNPVVWLSVSGAAAVLRTVTLHPSAAAGDAGTQATSLARARRAVRRELSRLSGGDSGGGSDDRPDPGGGIVVFPQQYGLDGVRLCEAVTRYAGDEASRRELVPVLPQPGLRAS